MTKNRVAGHYARAGQGKNKRVHRPPTPTAASSEALAAETSVTPASPPSPVARPERSIASPSSVPPRSTLSRLNLRPTSVAPTVNYDYVGQDLKRIGILTSIAVVILGVLTVVLG